MGPGHRGAVAQRIDPVPEEPEMERLKAEPKANARQKDAEGRGRDSARLETRRQQTQTRHKPGSPHAYYKVPVNSTTEPADNRGRSPPDPDLPAVLHLLQQDRTRPPDADAAVPVTKEDLIDFSWMVDGNSTATVRPAMSAPSSSLSQKPR